MAYSKQTWDTNSIFTPTRMNHIEEGIEGVDLTGGGTVNGRLYVDEHNGTTTSDGSSTLELGNNIISGVNGNSRARLWMYSNNDKSARVYAKDNMAANRNIYFPDNNGTLVVDSDFVVHTATPNTSYMNSNQKIYWSQSGKIVTGCGRITITSQKPSGQSNYLFKDLPVPICTIASVNCAQESLVMIVNGDGYLTSNLAIPASTYNITFSYVVSY